MAIDDLTDWMEDVALAEANERIAGLEAEARVFKPAVERCAELEEALEQTVFAHKVSDEWRSHWQTKAAEQATELVELRRGVDNIKVRSYELGQHELHDMALALLPEKQHPKETSDER